MANSTSSKRTADGPTTQNEGGRAGSTKRPRRGANRERSPSTSSTIPEETLIENTGVDVSDTAPDNEKATDVVSNEKEKDGEEEEEEEPMRYEVNAFNSILEAKFDTVSILKQGNVLTVNRLPDGQSIRGPFHVVLPTEVFFSSPKVVARLARISAKDRINHIRNISLIDDFDNLRDNNFIANQYGIQRFFTLGVVSFSQLFPDFVKDSQYPVRNKQLCIIPFAPLWERAKAVLFKIFGDQPMFISTYQNGLSFTSQWKSDTQGGAKVSVSSPSKLGNTVPAITPFESEIPVYDGRNKFTLQNFTTLPRERGEIDGGSAVAVMFTAKKFMRPAADTFKTSVIFYIQSVIVLADPDKRDLDTANFDIKRHAMGVDFVDEYEKYYGSLPSEEVVEPDIADEV